MYFLTTYRIIDGQIDDRRTIGTNNSYAYLFDVAIENYYDIYECGYYQYACITFVNEGIYPNNVEQQWFKYNKETDKGITLSLLKEQYPDLKNIEDYIIG